MPEATANPLPRRVAPGGSYSVSCVSVALESPPGSAPLAARAAIPALQRAHAAGVTGFDLSGLSSPEWGIELLREAFPTPDPELVIIVGPPRADLSASAPLSDESARVEALRTQISRWRERASPTRQYLVDWSDPVADRASQPPPVRALDRLREEGLIVDYALPLRDEEARAKARPEVHRPLRSAPLSLLDLHALDAIEREAPADRPGLIARDVFAGGSLDGGLLGRSPLERGPTRPPETVAALHARLDPVLKLGFLTRGRRRSLPQAALAFVLQWPWVLTAVVPLPAPEPGPGLWGRPFGDPLDATELDRLGIRVPAPTRPAPPSSGLK